MITTIVFLITLLTAFFVGLLATKDTVKRRPYTTLSLCSLLVICLALQLFFPQLLLSFERNASEIYAGQWWRIFTALFFQDGGLSGGISNIVFLAMIGGVVEQVFKRWQWLALYFGAGIVTEFIALRWQPIGAGNSIAFFGLAAGIIVFALIKKRSASIFVLGMISTLSAVCLLFQYNIHGAAFVLGGLLSLLILYKKNHRLLNR